MGSTIAADTTDQTTTRSLSVFTVGPYYFVAHDADDAWRLLEEHTGLKPGDDDVCDDMPSQVSDTEIIKILLEDGRPEVDALTAAQWCAREGRGFLCSTEY